MTQYYKPVVIHGEAQMIPDQLTGFFVRKDEYLNELATVATDAANRFNEAQSDFYIELDRIEAVNKELHEIISNKEQ